jgi:hypothetical protein
MTIKLSFKYFIFVILFELLMYFTLDKFGIVFINSAMLIFATYLAIGFFKATQHYNKIIKNTIPGSKFHSILVKGLKDSDYSLALTDFNWDWVIYDDGDNKYTIDGVHPVAKRIIVHTTYI